MAGEAVMRGAGVELPELLAGRGVEHVEPAVARADVDAAAGHDRRRVDARPRRERPGRLAGGRVDRVDDLVAAADDHAAVAERGGRVVGKLRDPDRE